MNKFKSTLLALILPATLLSTAAAQQEPSYMKKHNDWRVECTEVVQNNKPIKQCAMSSQSFVLFKENKSADSPESRELILNTTISYLGNDEHPSMLFTTLLGNSLLDGLKFDIDGKKLKIGDDTVEGLPFNRCLPNGCVAGLQLNDAKSLESIKKGNKMNVAYTHFLFDGDQDNVKAEVSLMGFTDAFEDLKTQLGK